MSFYTDDELEKLKLKVLPQELLDIIYHKTLLVKLDHHWRPSYYVLQQMEEKLQLEGAVLFNCYISCNEYNKSMVFEK